MDQLVQILKTIINGAEINSANLRDLSIELGIKKDFSSWAKKNLELFEENVDYIKLPKKREQGYTGSGGGLNKIEYIISIDVAKHISMLQRNEKGKEVRDYFIDAEKKAAKFQLPDFEDPVASALAWAKEYKEKQALIKTVAKKDELIVTVAKLNIEAGQVSFADFAKNLAIEGMGRNNTIKFCKAKGYLMDNTEPYQPYIERGYFVRKPSPEKINGKIRYQTLLTPRGCVWLARIIRAEYELDDERYVSIESQ